MAEQLNNAYFTPEAIRSLIACEGKELKGVICFLWQNSINKNDVVELIDHVQFVFTDGYKITLGSNPRGDGLDVVKYDFEKEKAETEIEFGSKIKIYAINASPTKMWEEVIGSKLIAIQLTKESEYYLSDSLVIDFGAEKRIIAISPLDGLIIDFYED